MGKMSG